MTRTAWMLILVAVVSFVGLRLLFRKKTPAQRIARLETEVAKAGGIVFRATLDGRETAFLLQKCNLYVLDASTDKVRRNKVLDAGFYLGFTTCTRQSIVYDEQEGYVRVVLGKTAIGAGGCCAAGGSYRSKDGVNWEKDTAKGWRPVAEVQA